MRPKEDPSGLNGRFEALCSWIGRPPIPPGMLLRAALLQAFFPVRSGPEPISVDGTLIGAWANAWNGTMQWRSRSQTRVP